MTANQIAYQKHLEDKRSNRANETELKRSHLAGERETKRHNLVTEGQTNLTIEETRRSNLAREAETERSNRAKEAEIYRSNVAKEQETKRINTEKNRVDKSNARWNARQTAATIDKLKAETEKIGYDAQVSNWKSQNEEFDHYTRWYDLIMEGVGTIVPG